MKKFTAPTVEVSVFSIEDIISTSECGGYSECLNQTGIDWD